jgi:hypothetical protein
VQILPKAAGFCNVLTLFRHKRTRYVVYLSAFRVCISPFLSLCAFSPHQGSTAIEADHTVCGRHHDHCNGIMSNISLFVLRDLPFAAASLRHAGRADIPFSIAGNPSSLNFGRRLFSFMHFP